MHAKKKKKKKKNTHKCYILFGFILPNFLNNNKHIWFPLKDFVIYLLSKSTVPFSHGSV